MANGRRYDGVRPYLFAKRRGRQPDQWRLRLGVLRDSMKQNAIIQRHDGIEPEPGHCKLACFDMPDASFRYGMPGKWGGEGVRECLQNWMEFSSAKEMREFMRRMRRFDYVASNRNALLDGCISARQVADYRKRADKIYRYPKVLRADDVKARRNPPAPELKQRPPKRSDTTVAKIISMQYRRDWIDGVIESDNRLQREEKLRRALVKSHAEERDAKHVELLRKRRQAQEEGATVGAAAVHPSGKHPPASTEEENAKQAARREMLQANFLMKRFRNANSILNTFRSGDARRHAYSKAGKPLAVDDESTDVELRMRLPLEKRSKRILLRRGQVAAAAQDMATHPDDEGSQSSVATQRNVVGIDSQGRPIIGGHIARDTE